MRLQELAEKLGCRLIGDGEIEILGLASIEEAGEGDLTFVADPGYLEGLERSRAAAAILREGDPASSKPTLRTDDPYVAFVAALRLLYPPDPPLPGVHPSSIVRPGARLADGVSVGPLSYIEEGVVIGRRSAIVAQVYVGKGSRIGADCLLYPQVVIREGVEIGDRVIIHSGAVIGSDGFGYLRDRRGTRVKIPQVGRVVIEDDVEIGANATIDRATLGATLLKRGAKIDNLVQIAHNVTVGEDTVIAAQTGISGSVRIGDRVMMGGQVGIADHIEIGDDVAVGAKGGITKDVPKGKILLGSPAKDHMEFKRSLAAVSRLPRLLKAVEAMEARLRALENSAAPSASGARGEVG